VRHDGFKKAMRRMDGGLPLSFEPKFPSVKKVDRLSCPFLEAGVRILKHLDEGTSVRALNLFYWVTTEQGENYWNERAYERVPLSADDIAYIRDIGNYFVGVRAYE